MREKELQPMRDALSNHLRFTYEHLAIPIKSVAARAKKFANFMPSHQIRGQVEKYNAIIEKLRRECPVFFNQPGGTIDHVRLIF